MELSSTVPPFVLRHSLWLATGAEACFRREASVLVFGFILPHPECYKKEDNNKKLKLYLKNKIKVAAHRLSLIVGVLLPVV